MENTKQSTVKTPEKPSKKKQEKKPSRFKYVKSRKCDIDHKMRRPCCFPTHELVFVVVVNGLVLIAQASLAIFWLVMEIERVPKSKNFVIIPFLLTLEMVLTIGYFLGSIAFYFVCRPKSYLNVMFHSLGFLVVHIFSCVLNAIAWCMADDDIFPYARFPASSSMSVAGFGVLLCLVIIIANSIAHCKKGEFCACSRVNIKKLHKRLDAPTSNAKREKKVFLSVEQYAEALKNLKEKKAKKSDQKTESKEEEKKKDCEKKSEEKKKNESKMEEPSKMKTVEATMKTGSKEKKKTTGEGVEKLVTPEEIGDLAMDDGYENFGPDGQGGTMEATLYESNDDTNDNNPVKTTNVRRKASFGTSSMRRKLAANNKKIEPRRAGSKEPGLAGSKELVTQEDEGKRTPTAIVIGGTKAVTALEKKPTVLERRRASKEGVARAATAIEKKPTVLQEKKKGSKETVELRTAGSNDKQLAPKPSNANVRKGASKEALGLKPSGGNVRKSASKETAVGQKASKENQKA